MKILIDGMGGDFAPEEIVKGAVKAAAEIDETVVIIGPEKEINDQLRHNRWNGDNIEVVDATEVITNHETPAMAVRKKKDSTIVKGMNMVKEGEADVFFLTAEPMWSPSQSTSSKTDSWAAYSSRESPATKCL